MALMLKTAPNSLNGRYKVYEETFRSPFEKDTESDALGVLDEIRATHSSKHGWVEISSRIEKTPDNKFVAVRQHAKYEWVIKKFPAIC